MMPSKRQDLFTVYQLVKSDLYTKYRRSFIGVIWLIVDPLFTVLIWLFMHISGILNPGDSNVSYATYILLSTALWMLFMNVFTQTSQTLITYNRVIITANISHAVLVASKIVSATLTSIISIILIIIAIAFIDVDLQMSMILVPLALVPLIIAGTVLGLINALLSVVTVDLSKLFSYAMQFVKYATPVVYTPNVNSGFLKQVAGYNPLSTLVGLPRDLILGTDFYTWPVFIGISIVSIITLIIFFWIFLNRSKVIIERLIAG